MGDIVQRLEQHRRSAILVDAKNEIKRLRKIVDAITKILHENERLSAELSTRENECARWYERFHAQSAEGNKWLDWLVHLRKCGRLSGINTLLDEMNAVSAQQESTG